MTQRLVPVLLLAAAATHAATITFTVSALQNGSNVRLSLDSGATYAEDLIGEIKLTTTSSTGFTAPEKAPGVLYGFCLEPEQGISLNGSYTYNVSSVASVAPTVAAPSGIGAVKADLLRELYGRYYADFQQVNPVVVLPGITSSAVITAGALQIASWEIVRETSGTYNVSTGVVQVLNSLATPNANFADIVLTANTMLSSLNGSGPLAQRLYAITHGNATSGNQDLAFQSAVPEPATWGLMLAGMALAWQGRRRKQAAAEQAR